LAKPPKPAVKGKPKKPQTPPIQKPPQNSMLMVSPPEMPPKGQKPQQDIKSKEVSSIQLSEGLKDEDEPVFDDYMDDGDAVLNLKESMQALRKRVARNEAAQ